MTPVITEQQNTEIVRNTIADRDRDILFPGHDHARAAYLNTPAAGRVLSQPSYLLVNGGSDGLKEFLGCQPGRAAGQHG